MADLQTIASKLNVDFEKKSSATKSEAEVTNKTGQKRRAWLTNTASDTESIISISEINPDDIALWIHKDRPENELGDLESFAKEIKLLGQIQPGTVRPLTLNNTKHKYELIIGERRWRACKIAGILFRAEVKPYSDVEAALAQAAENEERKELSDYAKGISFSKLIESNILKQSDLIEKLGKSKQQISRLLSFREIPLELITAIGDMTKVSARTAEAIKQLCKKDSNNLQILLSLSEKISSGIGHNTLEKHIKKHTNSLDILTDKIFSSDGRHLFSWRKDGNGNTSASFPQEIRKILNFKALEKTMLVELERQIQIIKSPPGGTNLKQKEI